MVNIRLPSKQSTLTGTLVILMSVCLSVATGFPAAAYAAYAAGRGYSGYPSFGLPYPAGNSHHHPLALLPYTLDPLYLHAVPLWTPRRLTQSIHVSFWLTTITNFNTRYYVFTYAIFSLSGLCCYLLLVFNINFALFPYYVRILYLQRKRKNSMQLTWFIEILSVQDELIIIFTYRYHFYFYLFSSNVAVTNIMDIRVIDITILWCTI